MLSDEVLERLYREIMVNGRSMASNVDNAGSINDGTYAAIRRETPTFWNSYRGGRAMNFAEARVGMFVRTMNGEGMRIPIRGLTRARVGRVTEVRATTSQIWVEWGNGIGSIAHYSEELETVNPMFAVGSKVRAVGRPILSGATLYTTRGATIALPLAGVIGNVDDVRLNPQSPDGLEYRITWASLGTYYHLANELEPVVEEVAVAPRRPRPRIQISRNTSDEWSITEQHCNLADIDFHSVKQFMPVQYAKLIPRRVWNRRVMYGGLHQFALSCINEYAIPPAVMVDALLEAVMADQAMKDQGEFSAEARDIVDDDLAKLIAQQPPLIAIGDKLFSLKAHGVVSGSRGMAIIRQKVLSNAKQSAVKLLENARQEARQIVAQGEKQLIKINADILKAREEGKLILPDWVVKAELAVKANTSRRDQFKWYVRLQISLKVNEFSFNDGNGTTFKFNALPWPDNFTGPTYIHVWMPIDFNTGAIKYNGTHDGCRTEEAEWVLPHIKATGCCMELQGVPKEAKNPVTLNKVAEIISRGMHEVNMNSLLGSYIEWHPSIKAQTPKVLVTYLSGAEIPAAELNAYARSRTLWMTSKADEKISVEVEAKEIFDIGSLEARVAEAYRAHGASITVDGPAINEGPQPEIEWAPEEEAGQQVETEEPAETLTVDQISEQIRAVATEARRRRG